jgi:SAM-dependent methyltransferase
VRPEIRAEQRPDCIMCGSRGVPLYRGLQDRLFKAPGSWDLSQCPNPQCSLVWLDPMPIVADIGKAYSNYYTHDRRIAPFTEQLASWMLFGVLGLLRERRRLELMCIDRKRPGHLLEIGFGDGRRLEHLSALGWIVEGQEVDPVAVRNARDRGLTVHEGPLPACGLPGGRYTAIVGSHVIEHVHDPIALVQECRRLLAPGGTLVLLTPNTASYGHERFGAAWLHLDPPRHLHLFSARTMEALLSRAGFRDVRVRSTMARAGSVLRGSYDIARRGHHAMGSTPTIATALAEMLHLFKARLNQSRSVHSGEELVAIATKMPTSSEERT